MEPLNFDQDPEGANAARVELGLKPITIEELAAKRAAENKQGRPPTPRPRPRQMP